MTKKFITYFFKLIYLLISWFVIAYTCSGDINVNLFCISIFTYSGGVVFDSIFYYYESFETNTVLRKAIIGLSAISFAGNLLVAFSSLIASQFIIIPFHEKLNKYIISFDIINNGIINLFPNLANWYIELPKIMLGIMLIGIFSLLPAFLIEVDSYIRIENSEKKKEGK